MRRVNFDGVARFCVDPAAIVAEATWKVERVEAIVIQYRQKHIAVGWNFLEDEMPHGAYIGHAGKATLI